jgi:chaperonin cofactor prefoldin
MNDFLIPVFSYLRSNPLSFINIFCVFILISYAIKEFDSVSSFFKKLDWKWYASFVTLVIFIYGESIINIIEDKPPAYVVYLTLFIAIFFGCLTVYFNSNKVMIDSFKEKVDQNEKKSSSLETKSKDLEVATTKLDKQSRDLQTKTSLARKMSMDTLKEVKAVQGQVKELQSQFTHLEHRIDTLEGRFDTLEGRFDTLEGRFDNLEVEMRTNFNGVNSQLEVITALLQNRTN